MALRSARRHDLALLSLAAAVTFAVSLGGLVTACGHSSPAAGSGGSGGGGGADAGASLDPAHCVFETPPTHPTSSDPIPASAIRVGVGAAVLDMPIGTPLGGYTNRCSVIPLPGQVGAVDGRPLRFARGFVPSIGLADAPQAEAIAIEAGSDRVVLVRIDAVLVDENNLFDLENAIAPDGSMRGHVVVSASHSHSSWAAWQASKVLMPGVDMTRKELSARMTASMAAAAKQALANLAPARIGFAVEPNFDPGDTVTHDRRYSGKHILGPDGKPALMGKDPVVWAMRVDDMSGKPVAAIIDLPIHGIVGDENNPLATADAPGAIERALTAQLGVPVLHFQGAAGNINPSVDAGRTSCPDPSRCLDLPRLEVIGARAAALVAPLIQGIQTSAQAAMEVVTRTFPVRRDQIVSRPDGTVLQYAPYDPSHEASDVFFTDAGVAASPIDQFDTVSGAGLCGDDSPLFDSLPGSPTGPYTSCIDLKHGRNDIFDAFHVTDPEPLPLCDTVRSTATAIRISGLASGDWLIQTAPGEPTAPFAAYLRERSAAGKDHTLIIGYADDHAGYLLTAEDWLNGGYEPSINIWGPLEGEMILDGVIATGSVAWTPQREDPEVGSSRFLDFVYPDTSSVPQLTTTDHGMEATPSPDLHWPDTSAAVTLAAGSSIPRAVGAARFVWTGGDPAVDLPEVIIERETTPGTFAPLTDAGGRPASSRSGAAVITYVPEPVASTTPTSHVYGVVWQPVPPDPYSLSAPAAPYALPLGRYRFHVKGNALAASGKVAYDLASQPFTVIAAPLDPASTATRTASGISVQATLGAAPGLRALRDAASDTGVTLPGPWTVTVSFSGAPAQTIMVTPDATGTGAVPLGAADLAQAVSVDVRDAAGNGGSIMVP